MSMRRLRAAILVAVSLAAVLAAQPVAAATVIGSGGTYGTYVLQDNADTTRGADCVYETSKETHNGVKGYWLDKLSIRGPKLHAYDDGSGKSQYVGWKYKVQTQPTSDSGAPWKDIHVSPMTKRQVSIASGYQFPRRTYTAPESLGDVNVRVVVVLKWYKRPGSSTSQGTVKASYDHYHVKGGGTETIRQTDCYRLN